MTDHQIALMIAYYVGIVPAWILFHKLIWEPGMDYDYEAPAFLFIVVLFGVFWPLTVPIVLAGKLCWKVYKVIRGIR